MAESLYTTGGTVQAQEGGLYLVRPADQQLLELCRQSRFAYVLTPRQLGKSSLMIRTAEELLAEGFRAVMVDLTQIGTGSDAEKWYGDVLEVVADQLELTTNARTWWQQEAATGLTLRLTRFFEEVVLAEVIEPIVIFVDEIDTTLSLSFTDDFFAAIRYFYVARAQNPALRRLSFVLIGVATPADLIRDPKRTPFNIGERVDLRDFTPAEAAPLAAGLPLPPEQAQRALGWILGWTGGHPYLSQRLCSVLAADPPAEWSEAAVDQAVGRSFFGERSEQDNNLQFVRDMLTKRAPQGYGAELLRTFRSIWQGKQPVADEEQNLVHAHLKLAGVVRRDGRQLVVRNRLYREVFNAAWIGEHNSEDFWKRYGPVLKWAVPVSVSALLVAGVMAALALEARRQSIEARRQTDRAEAAQRRALMQEDRATRQARRALQAEARAKTSETKALARERDTQRALQQLRQSQRQERQALTTAEQQRQRAEQEAVVARQQRGRAEQQTLLARAQTALANLRAQVAQALNLLPTAEGAVLAMDAWSRSQSIPAVRGASASALLQALLTSQETNRIVHGEWVTAVAFSPDGRLIASSSYVDGSLRLWEAQSGAAIRQPIKGHQVEGVHVGVLSVAFSPDGRQIASGGQDSTVRLWEVNSGAAIGLPLKGHEGSVMSVAFSPDGRLIASAGADGTLRLWDAKKGVAIRAPQMAHNSGALSVVFSPDGLLMASGGEDKIVRLWNVKTGASIGSPIQHYERVPSVSFSPDGSLIAGTGDGGLGLLRFYNSKTGEFKNLFVDREDVVNTNGYKSVAFSPDGHLVASGGGENTVLVWDYRVSERIGSLPIVVGKGHQGSVVSVAFNPYGSRIASGSMDGTVRLWDTTSSVAIGLSGLTLEGYNEPWSRALSPDGLKIASGGRDGTVRLWDAKSGASIGQPIKSDQGGVTSVAFSPFGSKVASGGEDGTVRLWDAESGATIGLPIKGSAGKVVKVAFSPDGSKIASGYEDGTVRVWDVKSGAALSAPLKLKDSEYIASMLFNPDGRIAFAADGKIILWDAASSTVASYRVNGDRSYRDIVTFSPDGRQIASASDRLIGETVRLWDVQSGAEIGTPLKGHNGKVIVMAYSPDSLLLASGGEDGTVRLWDTKTGLAIGPPFKVRIRNLDDEDAVDSLTFSPDGRSLVALTNYGRVFRWIASPQEWFRLGCARLAHHPLLRNPASVSTEPEMVAAGKRTHQACQAANRSAERAQHQGSSQGLAGLLAWARRLLP
jgi:WD40 repeat protein